MLDEGLTQRLLSCFACGFVALDFQEGLQRFIALQELLAGPHGLGPWCSLF